MQLDLFEDNRHGILLNIADEYLRGRMFEKALSTCQQVHDEYPKNLQAQQLCGLIPEWRAMLAEVGSSSCEPELLRELWAKLEGVTHPPLRRGVIEVLLELLEALPEPDQLFVPPRFHRGHLLLELGRFAEARSSFRHALPSPVLGQGRFLAWYADATTSAGNPEEAVSFYLQALLDDPATVDITFVRHPAIQALYRHCIQNADGIDADGEVAWLPVWGWLQGVFPLPLQHPPLFSELEMEFRSGVLPKPRLWYNLLTLAEHLRTVQRDDRQLPEIRRLMKCAHEEMFDCYMQKIRRTK